MFREITLGQFYRADSVIHRLDPRTKLFFTLVFIVGMFVASTAAGYGLVIAFLAVVIGLSQVPVRKVLAGLKPLWFIIAFTFLMNLFFGDRTTILWQWKFIVISKEALMRSFMLSLRLILLVMGTSMLTLTTPPLALTDGMESVMKPLAAIGFPAHEMAMMMTIALRFIPTLLEETDKIMKAQTARGADFASGGLFKRAKGIVPLLVPLFVSAFRRADDLAMAMESRCYRGGKGRTRLKVLRFSAADGVAFALTLLFAGAVFADRFAVARIWGIMRLV